MNKWARWYCHGTTTTVFNDKKIQRLKNLHYLLLNYYLQLSCRDMLIFNQFFKCFICFRTSVFLEPHQSVLIEMLNQPGTLRLQQDLHVITSYEAKRSSHSVAMIQ